MENEDNNETQAKKLEQSLANKANTEKTMIKRLEAMSMFSGPLPPPEILKAYDLVQPGLAVEIFDMAKKQSQHRMEMEKTVINGDSKRSWLGLIFGFILASICIGSSTFLILQGHDLAGSIFAGTTVVSLVGVFVYGSNQRAQERIEKQRALLEASIDDGK
ncbi:DUF2335 domain-containing protein [Nodularia harveyana UHCC-0300]|uniref:DUF2335 domain-containing protein n=1 Tax=Nodularia harveyana UHCC-0300 TaxID=2974287 RepID=A0ABU5UDZ2_9CYAN|nr:DUF2335 domain-containing protein [Nodularia harveyana]MEA5581722.1 DUF2335 domain-containing protein [Nodularia harveyana UHCC-0300]